MKIGILTLRLSSNYGGLLQAYATQKLLKDQGHEAVTIYFVRKEKSILRKIASILKKLVLKYIFKRKEMPPIISKTTPYKIRKIINRNTTNFLTEYIEITDPIYSAKEISKIKKYNFNAYLVGSDQVWRPEYCPDIPTYFLNFTIGDNQVKRRIAFAASFGKSKWRFTQEHTQISKKLIQQFDAVSVREDSAVQLCDTYLDKKAQLILDPTLLLGKEPYLKLIGNTQNKKNKEHIMVYILDKSPEKRFIINETSKKLNLNPLSIMPNHSYTEVGQEKLDECIFPKVSEWLEGFYNADFVITDSYHGTLFSILFNKQFITIGNTKRGMTRFKSILKLFNLEDRLITDKKELNTLLNKKINYFYVNKILEREQIKGLEFLKTNLS